MSSGGTVGYTGVSITTVRLEGITRGFRDVVFRASFDYRKSNGARLLGIPYLNLLSRTGAAPSVVDMPFGTSDGLFVGTWDPESSTSPRRRSYNLRFGSLFEWGGLRPPFRAVIIDLPQRLTCEEAEDPPNGCFFELGR